MANGETTVVKTALRAERLNNSRNGNPRYRLHFDDGTSALTQSDSSCAYEIGNHVIVNAALELTLTRAGRVCGIRKAEQPEGGQVMSYPYAFGRLEVAVQVYLEGRNTKDARERLERALRETRRGVALYGAGA